MVPFWMEESGFTNTGLKVKNEAYTYEVWRKAFPAGTVALGGAHEHRLRNPPAGSRVSGARVPN